MVIEGRLLKIEKRLKVKRYTYFYISIDHQQPKILIRGVVLPNTIKSVPGVATNF